MDRRAARTMLEYLIQASDLTIDETCRAFEKCARGMKESATLSPRQLNRWMSGNVEDARAPSRRVAREFWGRDFKDLLAPPPRASEQTRTVPEVPDLSGLDFPHGTPAANGIRGESFPSFLYEEVELSAHESARFVRRAGQPVTDTVLDQLNDDVRWLAVHFLRRPPYAVFRPIASLRREVFGLIDAHPRPEHLRELYAIAGQLSALLAHACSDLGQMYAAESNARTAWLCADPSDNKSLRVYTRWIQSNIAYWHGEYPDAAEIVTLAERYSADDSDRLRLLSQQARALAAMKDPIAADRALGKALVVRNRIAETATQPGVFHFSPGKAAYYASEVRIALGGESNLRLAVQEAGEAVHLLNRVNEPDHSPELVAAAQLDLTHAHLNSGDLDAACLDLRDVLALPVESRTVPIMHRIDTVDSLLQGPKYQQAPLAIEVRDEIEVFSAYPAARDLPGLPAPHER